MTRPHDHSLLLALALSALGSACNHGSGARDVDPAPAAPRNAQTQIGRLTSMGNGLYREWYDYDALGRIVQRWWRFDDRTYVSSATYGYPTRGAQNGELGIVLAAEGL